MLQHELLYLCLALPDLLFLCCLYLFCTCLHLNLTVSDWAEIEPQSDLERFLSALMLISLAVQTERAGVGSAASKSGKNTRILN